MSWIIETGDRKLARYASCRIGKYMCWEHEKRDTDLSAREKIRDTEGSVPEIWLHFMSNENKQSKIRCMCFYQEQTIMKV